MRLLIMTVSMSVFLMLTACGEGGGGQELTGAFTPQFAPGTPRYEMAMTDKQLRFMPGYKVEITNTGGTNTWDYSIRGKQIIMKHANGDVRKHYTTTSGNCLLLNEGKPDLELRYCPA